MAMASVSGAVTPVDTHGGSADTSAPLSVVSVLAVLLQVDPAYTGRVGASEAALFLKKSGLSDIILGKVGKMKHGLLHS